MLTLKGIKKTIDKLNRNQEEGDVEYTSKRGSENRYSYRYKGQLVFTFGITRGSSKKSKKFSYVPRQMHLKMSEYRRLHQCPMSKKDYNEKLIDEGQIRLPDE